jgi:hypothetical protein
MRFGPRMCLLGFQRQKIIWGVIPPKLPHFSAGIGISGLNVESNNFRTARPILVIHSSNDIYPQKEFNYVTKQLKFALLWNYYKSSPKGNFTAKILHSIIF